MIYKLVSLSDFINEFNEYGRGDQFTHEALDAMYDLLEETSGEQGFKLDVIGLCCEFTEYESEEEAVEAYNLETMKELEEHTLVLSLKNGGVLLQNY